VELFSHGRNVKADILSCPQDCTQRVVIIRERDYLIARSQSRIIARCISSVDFLHVSVHVCRTHVSPYVHLNTRLRGAIKPVIRRVPSETTRRRGAGKEDLKRAGRCYRRIGSQLGTYIHALNNSEAMISKLQITRRPTTKPAMGASSSLPRPVTTFCSFFFTILSSPLGPPLAYTLLAVLAAAGSSSLPSSSFSSASRSRRISPGPLRIGSSEVHSPKL